MAVFVEIVDMSNNTELRLPLTHVPRTGEAVLWYGLVRHVVAVEHDVHNDLVRVRIQ